MLFYRMGLVPLGGFSANFQPKSKGDRVSMNFSKSIYSVHVAFHVMHSDLWMLCPHRWDMKKGGVGLAASKRHPPSGATVRRSFNRSPATTRTTSTWTLPKHMSVFIKLGNADFWVKQMWEGRAGRRCFARFVRLVWLLNAQERD